MVVDDVAVETVGTPVELAKPLLDSVDDVMSENKEIVSELCKPVVYSVRTVQTQHGDYRTVDEENIVLLHITRSPVPEEQEEFIWFRNKPFDDDSNDDEVSRSNSLFLYLNNHIINTKC